MNDARLDLRLPSDLLGRVKRAAGGMPVNQFVRDVLERALLDEADGSLGPPVGEVSTAAYPVRGREDGVRLPAPVPSPGTRDKVVDEIPLPKIAPRRWGR